MRSINRPRRYSPARRPGCGSSEPNRRISTGRSKDSTVSSIAAGGPARSSAASANRRSAERARPSRCVHWIAASAQVVNRISWARRIGSPCGKHDSGVNNRSMPKADQSRAHLEELVGFGDPHRLSRSMHSMSRMLPALWRPLPAPFRQELHARRQK